MAGVPSKTFEVIVVGAGAAGLMAAARSAERGRRTLLIEKNRKAGVKILMSGGTRCNITHACDRRGIIEAFGARGAFLHSSLAALGPDELVALLEAEAVPTKVEAGGKIFPASNRAADVLNALLRRLQRSGAELALDEPVQDIKQQGTTFVVETNRRKFVGDKLIVTTGGKSYPGCGTVGDGYRWAAQLGHTIRRPRPALVPLTTKEAWLSDLAGVTIPDVSVRVVKRGGSAAGSKSPAGPNSRVPVTRRGSLLFTHFGLSGPVVLDVSGAVTEAGQPNEVSLIADFLPANSIEDLERCFRDAAAANGKQLVETVIAAFLPRRLTEAMLGRAGVPRGRKIAEFSAGERTRAIQQLKACEISISGTRGFEKAEVTAGGVELGEVDSRTMQSKRVPNLYLAGEILDLDGYIGGYNFQAAFSTGWLAGESV